MNEGLADYFSGTILNSSCMGDHFIREETYHRLLEEAPDHRHVQNWPCLRNLKNNLSYPEDYDAASSHAGSLVFSGSLWDLREELGKEIVDGMIIRSIKLNPRNFVEFLVNLLVVDDDNQNILDGTPHRDEICAAFADHGLGSLGCNDNLEEPVIELVSPEHHEVVSNEFTVRGTFVHSHHNEFIDYSIEYAKTETEEWSKEGVTLLWEELQAVNQELAAIEMPEDAREGKYHLRFTVRDEEGEMLQHQIDFFWYKNFWRFADGDEIHLSSPLILDLDHDGTKEIFFDNHLRHEAMIGYNINGDAIFNFETRRASPHHLASGDLDNDGTEEIVAQKYLWQNNLLWVFDDQPMHTIVEDGAMKCAPVLADLDNDGTLEIITQSWHKVWVFHHNLSVAQGWPKEIQPPSIRYTCSPIGVADIDADGRKEIVVVEPYSRGNISVYAWEGDGTLEEGWPTVIPYQNAPYSNLVLADLDNDGKVEVIVSRENSYILDYKGKIIAEFEMDSSYFIIGDVVGDQNLEIVNDLAVHDYKGNKLFDLAIPEQDYTSYSGFHPLLADLDGDGNIEIIQYAQGRHPLEEIFLLVFDNGGRLIEKIDLPEIWFYPNSIIVDDIDGDGLLEIAMALYEHFIYMDFEGSEVEWGQPSYDNQNTNFYSKNYFNFNPLDQCRDTDEGRNYMDWGYVKGTIGHGIERLDDSCTDEIHLREFWCNENSIAEEVVDCSQGGKICSEGACVTPLYGDINFDGFFGKPDVRCYIDIWNHKDNNCLNAPLIVTDFNCNGMIDIFDVDAVIILFLRGDLPDSIDGNGDGVPDCKGD